MLLDFTKPSTSKLCYALQTESYIQAPTEPNLSPQGRIFILTSPLRSDTLSSVFKTLSLEVSLQLTQAQTIASGLSRQAE